MATQSEIDIFLWCERELLCDSVRITRPGRKRFLVVGWKRHTSQEDGQWYRNGESIDFEFMEEHCIASGDSLRELFESARFYNALLGME